MKDLSILSLRIFFLALAALEQAKQSISSSIRLILTIIDPKVIPRELLGPANLVRAQAHYIYESTEVIAISQHKGFVLTAFKVMPLEGLNNGQELSIVVSYRV